MLVKDGHILSNMMEEEEEEEIFQPALWFSYTQHKNECAHIPS